MTAISNAPPGAYSIQFHDVPFYEAPAPQSVSVTAGGTATFLQHTIHTASGIKRRKNGGTSERPPLPPRARPRVATGCWISTSMRTTLGRSALATAENADDSRRARANRT